MTKSEQEYRNEIVEIGGRLHQQGFVAGTDGNLSVRLEGDRILTTPTQMSKAMLRPEDLVVVNRKGNKISGSRNASTELGMHLQVYECRPDAQAVVHAHPPTATGFAAAGLPLNQALLCEVVVALGWVPLARYGTPGTPELSEALRDFIPHYDAILMANHGVVTFGGDLLSAYFKMETVEHFARIALVTQLLGRESLLSSQDVLRLFEARARYFGASSGPPMPGELPLVSDGPDSPKRS